MPFTRREEVSFLQASTLKPSVLLLRYALNLCCLEKSAGISLFHFGLDLLVLCVRWIKHIAGPPTALLLGLTSIIIEVCNRLTSIIQSHLLDYFGIYNKHHWQSMFCTFTWLRQRYSFSLFIGSCQESSMFGLLWPSFKTIKIQSVKNCLWGLGMS